MKPKWYLSTLIIILTLTGLFFEQQISLPNQEIVLQFTDVEVTTAEVQNMLEVLKMQLHDLGAENIQIKEGANDILKILYYSDSDVAIIKDTLSKEKNLTQYKLKGQDEENSNFPSDGNTLPYNLDVHEIQNGHDADWVLNGTFVSELKPKSNKILNVSVHFTNSAGGIKESSLRTAYIVNKNSTTAIDNSSHNIPEVRAGPIC